MRKDSTPVKDKQFIDEEIKESKVNDIPGNPVVQELYSVTVPGFFFNSSSETMIKSYYESLSHFIPSESPQRQY